MDLFDIAILLIAFALAVLSARIGCWIAAHAFDLHSGHWVKRSWLWVPFVSMMIFLQWPVHHIHDLVRELQNTFLAVGVFLPMATISAVLVLAAVSKLLSSHRRGPANKGKPSA